MKQLKLPFDKTMDMHTYRVYASGDCHHQDEFPEVDAFEYSDDYAEYTIPLALIEHIEEEAGLNNGTT